MRFRKGSKVEVLNTREVPSGSWWCAEIVSGNVHSFSVRYEHSPPDMRDALLERVPRKSIRPCPPLVQCPAGWVTGDIVEVFDNGSWKLAEVSKVIHGKSFFVRLLGSSRTFKVHRSSLRLRMSWQDDKWAVIGKDSRSSDTGKTIKARHDQKLRYQVFPSCKRDQHYIHRGDYPAQNNTNLLEPCVVSSRGIKRGSQFCLTADEGHKPSKGKPRAVEGDHARQQLVAGNSSLLPDKVDAVASPQKLLGEKHMHASYNKRTGFSEIEVMKTPYADAGCFPARNLESTSADSDAFSVCSSSGSNSPDMYNYYLPGPSLDLDYYCSDDAHSFCGSESGRELSIPSEADVAADVHKVELHAYRSTLEALYASGPISWEQEALMTNLRLKLHISIDEHLLEIRHLTSGPS